MRCAIIDDCEQFLLAARHTLERDGVDVVGVATNVAEGFVRVCELRPDVALVDFCLGEECGLALAEQIAECSTCSPVVIIISTYSEDDGNLLIDKNVAAFLAKTKLTGQAVREIVYRAWN